MAQQSGSGVLGELLERGRLVWRLLNDERVPRWLKLSIPVLVLLYFVSPIDLIPDFLLGLGQLDDLGVILLGMALFIRLAPEVAVDEHRRALGMDHERPGGEPTRRTSRDTNPIEGEYRVADRTNLDGTEQ
ncbi:MAG: DUF1232 domain-containing protein [Chloroflexia bacterium]